MDGEADVFGERSHFDGEYAFGDHLAGSHADDADTENTLGVGIDEKLGHAFGAVESDGAAGGSPGKLRDFDFAIFFLRLRFGESAPGDFRIGEDDSGDSGWLEGDFVSGNGFDGGAAFVHRFVGEHGFADYIADGVDGRIGSLKLFVHFDETFGADFDLSLVEAGDFRVGLAADGDQDAVEELFLHSAILRFQRGANAGGFVLHRFDGGVEQDAGKHFFQALVERQDEVAIGAREQAGKHFYNSDAGSEGGVDGAEFETDISSADYEQSAGDIFEIQRAAGIHHARSVELERRNNCGAGAGRDNDAVEGETLFCAVGFTDAQCPGVFKRGAALHEFHFALLGENAESSGQLFYDAFFPRAQARQIDVWRLKVDAPGFGLFRFFEQLGYVQQGLRRDAAAVEADSAGVCLGIDKGDGHAEIGGEECGGIASGACADECDVHGFGHKGFNHRGRRGTRRKDGAFSIFSWLSLFPLWFMILILYF